MDVKTDWESRFPLTTPPRATRVTDQSITKLSNV